MVRRPADAGLDAETSRNIVWVVLSTLVDARSDGENGRSDEQDEGGDEQRDDLAPASTEFGARGYRLAVRFRPHPIGPRVRGAYEYFLDFFVRNVAARGPCYHEDACEGGGASV